jgi:hypothetical protein
MRPGGTHFDSGESYAADSADRVSSRPDFLILCYPVISMQASITDAGSRRNLLGLALRRPECRRK